MEMKIDLHIHTNISDGALSPKEVIDEAKKNGVSVIAIADHDTIDAYNDELFSYALDNNIKIINAVEVSTKVGKAGFHVLGYNFDITNNELIEKLAVLRNARHNYLFNVAEQLNKLGYILNTDKLDKIEAVTKAHIALDVVENEVNKDLLLNNFGHIPSKGEFIETIMNEGCPAYVEKETITPVDAAKLIRSAGGKVVLAHPVAYKYEDNTDENFIVNLVKEMKADGIEANYIYFDRNDNKIDEVSKWNRIATDNNLIATIGSDFHNKDGLRPEIGFVNEGFVLDIEAIEHILNYILN